MDSNFQSLKNLHRFILYIRYFKDGADQQYVVLHLTLELPTLMVSKIVFRYNLTHNYVLLLADIHILAIIQDGARQFLLFSRIT